MSIQIDTEMRFYCSCRIKHVIEMNKTIYLDKCSSNFFFENSVFQIAKDRIRPDDYASYVTTPTFLLCPLCIIFLQFEPKDLWLLTKKLGGYRRRLPGRCSSAIAVCWGHQTTYHPSWLCSKSAVRVLHFRNHWRCNEVCMVWQGLTASAPVQIPL